MTIRLSRSTLGRLANQVITPRYRLDRVKRGVAHIGVGNFHRAHQATYFDDLLRAGEMNWGISGICLRSSRARDALAPQNFLYTLMQADQRTSYRVVGAIQDIIVAPRLPELAIAALAANETSVVTTTITEKGYLLRNGSIDFDHPMYRQDLSRSGAPKSVFGFLAASIRRRMEQDAGPLSIICCDNIQGGGSILREGTHGLLCQYAKDVVTWAEDNVSFVSSMVDRVAPVTSDGLVRLVASQTGVEDAWPVATESFRQWVIEDSFPSKRPPLDLVGVEFADDIALHERMKLRYLNACHSIIGAIGYLLGETYTHSALKHRGLARFSRNALAEEVHGFMALPPASDGLAYIDTCLERFRNASLPYLIAQLCSDSSEKVQQRWFPSIERLIRCRRPPRYFTFALAAWAIQIEQAIDERTLVDSRRGELTEVLEGNRQTGSPVRGLLRVAGAQTYEFWNDSHVMNATECAYREIKRWGIDEALHRHTEALRKGSVSHA